MRMRTKATFLLVLVLALTGAIPVAAAEATDQELLPCAEGTVSGVITAVDPETGTVVVDTGEGLCTVTLDSEYDHPIVDLLGSYFADVSSESLAAALAATQVCAVEDEESGEWVWADCEDEGAVEVTVTGEEEADPCAFAAETAEGEPIVLVADEDACANLDQALDELDVEWDVDDQGALLGPGDEIAAYHEDGMGFGVLVKLYAMADESQEYCAEAEGMCGVTVEELATLFRSGTGMGLLFKEYGKPAKHGVGHVRHAGDDDESSVDDDESGGADPSGDVEIGASSEKRTGKPDHAGPKPKAEKHTGKPDHAGPKPKKAK